MTTQGSFKLTLQISHPFLDPESITRALGLPPDHTAKAGSQRKTPTGRRLDGKNSKSRWVRELSEGGDLEALIQAANSSLQNGRTLLHDVVNSGGTNVYYIGCSVDRHLGAIVSAPILKDCADLAIGIALDIYGPDQDDQ